VSNTPSAGDVVAAAERIAPHVHRTPVFTSRTLDELLGAAVFFKCENLQKTGAFKFRGACNAVLSLTDEQARAGVATHSSGNHGAALACAASLRGIPVRVVMPETANPAKIRAVTHYRGEVLPCAPTLAAREKSLAAYVEESGATVVHPFNDAQVIAGQGTAAREFFEQVADLDLLLTPVGGGGLISGTALVAKDQDRGVRVVGVEPAGADDAQRSLRSGERVANTAPDTIADGLHASLGPLTFAIIEQSVDDIVTVNDADTVHAMRWFWERLKLVIEPSAAVAVAALMQGKVDVSGRRVGVILSGGNADLDALPW